MATTFRDPAERSGYLRLFYRDWRPDPPGKARERGLGVVVGVGPDAPNPPHVAGQRPGGLVATMQSAGGYLRADHVTDAAADGE
jgi:hypothetical protein